MDNKDSGLHGWISSSPTVGFWVIFPSQEFRNGGPTKQNLTIHTGPACLAVRTNLHYRLKGNEGCILLKSYYFFGLSDVSWNSLYWRGYCGSFRRWGNMEEGFWPLLCIPEFYSKCIRCTQLMDRCQETGTYSFSVEVMCCQIWSRGNEMQNNSLWPCSQIHIFLSNNKKGIPLFFPCLAHPRGCWRRRHGHMILYHHTISSLLKNVVRFRGDCWFKTGN